MQEALQLAASLMITRVTLNDVATYYIVTELESVRSHRKESPAFLFYRGDRLQTPFSSSKRRSVCVKSDDVKVEQSSAFCRLTAVPLPPQHPQTSEMDDKLIICRRIFLT